MQFRFFFAMIALVLSASTAGGMEIPASFHPEMSLGDREWLHARRCAVPNDGQAAKPSRALPAAVTNHLYLPKVGSQGAAESCYYWAWCYYLRTWQEARERGWQHPNPAVNPERVNDPNFMYRLKTVAPFLIAFGCPTLVSAAWDTTGNFPTAACFQEAQLHRIADLWALNPQGDTADEIAYLKGRLAGGDLAYCGFYAYDNVVKYGGGNGDGFNNSVLFAYGGPNLGPHALTIAGYDDARSYNDGSGTKTGAFLLVNSWGPGWGWTLPAVGTGGFIWVGYGFFTAAVLDSVAFMEDAPSVAAKDFAVIDYQHPIAKELSMSISSGDPEAGPDAGASINISNALNLLPVNGPVRVPIDRLTAGGARRFRLDALDVDVPATYGPGTRLGTIRGFQILLDGQPPWVSTQTPVTTTDWNVLNPADIPLHAISLDLGPFSEKYITKDLQQYGTGTYQMHVGDFDGDGDPDILTRYPTAWESYKLAMRKNNGDGTFALIDTNLPTGDVRVEAVGDFNNDGALDAIVAGTNFALYYGGGGAIQTFTDSGVRFPVVDKPGEARAVDWDHDGRLDLAVSYRLGPYAPPPEFAWRFYWNDGAGAFRLSTWRLPYQNDQHAFMDFGDMNRDGREELVVAACAKVNGSNKYGIKVLAWQGETTLPKQIAEVGGLAWDTIYGVQLADYDGDGWLDIIMRTAAGGHRVWRNLAGTAFAELASDLASLDTLAFGDVDNDGRPDVAAQGVHGGDPHTGLYRNLGGGHFSYLAGPEATPNDHTNDEDLIKAAVALADFDRDGDLDFVAAGKYWPAGVTDISVYYAGLHYYENLTAQAARAGRPNAPPGIPALTSAGTTPIVPDELIVTWTTGADDTTPAGQQAFRFRLGSRPGWGDIGTDVFPLSHHAGLRPKPDAAGACQTKIQIPTNKPVYLALQAIDQGLAASPWCPSAEIVPAGTPSPYDVNRDSKINVVDVVKLLKLIGLTDATSLARGDISGDGRITALDRTQLLTYLIGSPSPGEETVEVLDVKPAAPAVYTSSDFALTIPAGTVATPMSVLIRQSPEVPLGVGPVPETFFRLEGMPETRGTKLQLKFPVGSLDPARTVLLFGVEALRTTTWDRQLTWMPFRPVSVAGGWMTFEVPALTATGLAKPGREPNPVSPVTNWAGLATDIQQMESTHFTVQYHYRHSAVEMNDLLTGLEWAWTEIKNVYGFSLAGIKGKVAVYIDESLDKNVDGLYCPVFHTISINPNNVGSELNPGIKKATVTGIHEFTHRVVKQYRDLIEIWGTGWETIWLDEATATWFESLYNKDSAPSTLDLHCLKPFQWGLYQSERHMAADYGYGMAPLIRYFTEYQGKKDFPRKLWEGIKAGKMTITAINAAAGQTEDLWWHDFAKQIIYNHLYTMSYSQLIMPAVGKKVWDTRKLTPEARTLSKGVVLEAPEIEDLSSTLYRIQLDPANQTSSMKLSLMLVHSIYSKMALTAFLDQRPPVQTLTPLGDAIEANGGLKVNVPITPEMFANDRLSILALASAKSAIPSYPSQSKTSALLYAAITQDKVWSSPAGITVKNGGTGEGLTGVGFTPAFNVHYTVDGPGLGQVQWRDMEDIGTDMWSWLLGLTPCGFDVNFSATYSQASSRVDGTNGYTIHSAGPIAYRFLITTENTAGQTVQTTIDSPTGKLARTIGRDDTTVNFDCRAVYDITEVRYDNANKVLQTIEHPGQTSRLGGVLLMARPILFQ